MAQLICPDCGLVYLKTTRCECGLTALDDSDFANRDAIDEAITLRRERMHTGASASSARRAASYWQVLQLGASDVQPPNCVPLKQPAGHVTDSHSAPR